MMPRRRILLALAVALPIVTLPLSIAACETGTPAASLLPTDPPCDGGKVCMSFQGQRYYAAGPTLVSPAPTWDPSQAGFEFVLPPNMKKLGTSDLVTPNAGQAGFDVLRIPGIDPSEAVASPITSAWPTEFAEAIRGPSVFLWINVGLFAYDIPGLCAYEIPHPCSTP
jgi:hypothetical protein